MNVPDLPAGAFGPAFLSDSTAFNLREPVLEGWSDNFRWCLNPDAEPGPLSADEECSVTNVKTLLGTTNPSIGCARGPKEESFCWYESPRQRYCPEIQRPRSGPNGRSTVLEMDRCVKTHALKAGAGRWICFAVTVFRLMSWTLK